jgi:hypothetical protein
VGGLPDVDRSVVKSATLAGLTVGGRITDKNSKVEVLNLHVVKE